jgi:hypothetical protein
MATPSKIIPSRRRRGGRSDCLCHHLYLLTFSCAESVSSPIQSAFAPP